MPITYSENIQYHGLTIPEVEKEWLRDIYLALSEQTLVMETIETALELAWKRGYAQGAR